LFSTIVQNPQFLCDAAYKHEKKIAWKVLKVKTFDTQNQIHLLAKFVINVKSQVINIHVCRWTADYKLNISKWVKILRSEKVVRPCIKSSFKMFRIISTTFIKS